VRIVAANGDARDHIPIMIAILSILAIAAAGLTLALVAKSFAYRGQRVVTCPETCRSVGAKIDGWLAARTELAGAPRYVISACSRWPEKSGCDQACAAQIASSPRGTLVQDIVARWYENKLCAFCGDGIGEIRGIVHPAVRTANGRIEDWSDVAPEDLPKILRDAVAVCARCDVVEIFRQDNPELVIERRRTPQAARPVLRSSAGY
jgi:hypothetical protein